MSKESYKGWSKYRSNGMIKFIFIYGVIYTGVYGGSLATILDCFYKKIMSSFPLSGVFFWSSIVARSILYSIGGIVVFFLVWIVQEGKWRKKHCLYGNGEKELL